LLAPGDVLHDRDLVLRLALRIARERHREVDPYDRVVLADVTLLELHRRDLAGAHAGAIDIGLIAVVGMRDLLDRAADQLGLAVAQHVAELVIDIDEAPGEVDVGDAGGCDLEGLAEAHLAFGERGFGLLSLQVLADLRTEHAHRADQPLVGLAHDAARDRQHADGTALESHREDEGAVHARLAHTRHRRRARIAANVRAPDRLAALPNAADQARPRGNGGAARALGEFRQRVDAVRPDFLAAHDAGGFVELEVAPAV